MWRLIKLRMVFKTYPNPLHLGRISVLNTIPEAQS
jgi:hypothetical protein